MSSSQVHMVFIDYGEHESIEPVAVFSDADVAQEYAFGRNSDAERTGDYERFIIKSYDLLETVPEKVSIFHTVPTPFVDSPFRTTESVIELPVDELAVGDGDYCALRNSGARVIERQNDFGGSGTYLVGFDKDEVEAAALELFSGRQAKTLEDFVQFGAA